MDDLPAWLRAQLLDDAKAVVSRESPSAVGFLGETLYERLAGEIERTLNRRPPGNPQRGPWAYYLPETFRTCEWSRFYDLCEIVYAVIKEKFDKVTAEALASRYNTQLAQEGVPWQFRNGRVEHSMPRTIESNIREVRALLTEPRFKGPDEQFQKAIAFLSARPKPDPENCIKEATGALEAVARILSGKTTDTLGSILKDHFKEKMPGSLFKAFEGVWGYASTEPGARHGKVGKAQTPFHNAELVLGLCAAMIPYLVHLEGSPK